LGSQGGLLRDHYHVVRPLLPGPLTEWFDQMYLRQIISLGGQYLQMDSQAVRRLLHGCTDDAAVRLITLAGFDEGHVQRRSRERRKPQQQEEGAPTDSGNEQTSGPS